MLEESCTEWSKTANHVSSFAPQWRPTSLSMLGRRLADLYVSCEFRLKVFLIYAVENCGTL
jgi:hypothetical protein